jgi:hypothetical protein
MIAAGNFVTLSKISRARWFEQMFVDMPPDIRSVSARESYAIVRVLVCLSGFEDIGHDHCWKFLHIFKITLASWFERIFVNMPPDFLSVSARESYAVVSVLPQRVSAMCYSFVSYLWQTFGVIFDAASVDRELYTGVRKSAGIMKSFLSRSSGDIFGVAVTSPAFHTFLCLRDHSFGSHLC